MEQNNILLTIAIIAVLLALANAVIVFQKVEDVSTIVGYATDTGTANLTVQESIAVNFTTDVINWGSGSHNSGVTSAKLNSEGVVENGTGWSTVTDGLILNNIGNVNVTLNLSASKNASEFIGGSNPDPEYKWRISDYQGHGDESGACVGINPTAYTAVNTTNRTVCDPLQWYNNRDEIEIDIEVIVPANCPKDEKGDVITAIASAA